MFDTDERNERNPPFQTSYNRYFSKIFGTSSIWSPSRAIHAIRANINASLDVLLSHHDVDFCIQTCASRNILKSSLGRPLFQIFSNA